jgi:PAS domain S-box-containing protein
MHETANEIKRLQGCINDLISLLALPAMWSGQDPAQMVSTLLDVLVGMLRLDFAYVRLNDPVGGGLIEMVRHDSLRHPGAEPRMIGQTLNDSLGANLRKWPPRASNPFGDGSLSIVPLGSGRDNEIGVIVSGSQRADFPWQTETVLLNVAANQAAIGLASARAYEQERLRAEALAEIDRVKTQFFNNVSHEFRTPLTLMLGPLEEVLPEAGERLGPERQQQLLTVRRNALRLLKLVNTLLDFSRIEAGRVQAVYQPTDLATLTSEIASAFQSAMDDAGLRFSVECQPIAEPVFVDCDMWEKIVLNLLSNALKFTFEGEVAITLKSVDGAVELQVRDTGVGIPDEQRERVFERFHRIESTYARTYEGTGIGLGLVQELVKLHGGSVRVESAIGVGSTFTVAIPRGKAHLPAERIRAEQSFASRETRAVAYVEEAQRWLSDASSAADDVAMLATLPSLASSSEAVPGTKREVIVLADDNADMRQYLSRLLSERYEVHGVADGREALEAARQLRPALVLADVMMPRLDGFGVLRAIRDDPALCSTPVILVSARAGEESRVEGLQADADDYLVKPFAARELLARVATHVKMANLRRETAEREERLRSEAELEREKLRASEERLVETSRLYRELQDRETKIRRLVDANIVGMFMWDLEGQILEANDAFLRILGYDREDLASGRMRWTELTPAEWRERDEQAIADLRRTDTVQPYEKEYFRKDGIRIPVLLGGATFEGSRNEGVAFVLDLSEQKQAEEALRRNKFYLSEGERLARTGSWAFDPAGFFNYWSPELFRIYGLDPAREAPSLRAYLDCIHPQDREFMSQLIREMVAKGLGCDVKKRIVRPDGAVRCIRCVGTPLLENGTLKTIVGTAMDVTEHEEMTQELQRREAYLAEAQRLSHTGSFGWRPDTGEIVWSDETYRIFEYNAAEKPTLNMVLRRIHPQDRALAQQVIEDVSKSGTDFEHEYRLLIPGGAIKHLHVRAHALHDPSGNVEFVGAVTDITERKRAEDSLRAAMAERTRLSTVRVEIAMALASKDSLRGILHRCAETMVRHLDAAFARIWTLKSGGAELELEASAGMYTRLDGRFSRIPVGQLKIGLIARERKAHMTNDVQNDPGISDHNWARAEKMQSFAGYPLVVEDRVVGVMGMFSRQALTESTVEILAFIADGLAQGIDRKRAEDALKLLKDQLYRENIALRDEVDRASMFDEIVGTSNPLKAVLSRIAKVAPTDSTVLITGETGTGKELIARAIHKRSQRSGRAFVSVNCAAIPRDLIPSELFGHEKGAFTGATQRRLGRFELADGGTIFLDEVGELLPDTQVALLRVLQERELERVGGAQPIHVDVRVIAATNRDLEAAVANGSFRQDLFYRLNVFPIELPPLRERKDDLRLLVEYFVQRYATKAGKEIRSIDKKTLDLLQSYDWPGNIRELQNVIERSVILIAGDVFSVDELWLPKEPFPPASLVKASPRAKSEVEPLSEREIIEAALAATRGRVSGPSGAAAKLGIPPSTLETRIKALQINKAQFKFR